MARSATIAGLVSLQRKLDRMPGVAKTKIREAMAETADEIVAMMKSLAEDPAIIASIAWTWGAVPKGSRIVAAVKGAGVGGDLTLTIYAGDNGAFYVWWWEFGTAERFHSTGKSVGSMSPSPFFFVSWRANRRKARNRVRRAVRLAARATVRGS